MPGTNRNRILKIARSVPRITTGSGAAFNFIQNPGFATGSFSSWTTSGSAIISTNTPTKSGTYHARLSGYGTVRQIMTGLTPNASYTVSFWARQDTGNTLFYWGIEYQTGGTNLVDRTANVTSAYSLFTGNFTMPANRTSVQIYILPDTGAIYLDDVSVVAI